MLIAEEIIDVIREAALKRLSGLELGVELELTAHLPSIDILRLLARVESHFDVDLFDGQRSLGPVITIGGLAAIVAAKGGLRGQDGA
jgi:hypothetical protein